MSRTFRYQEIADVIRGDIASGALAVGALLPSEAELCASHDASRVTIRKALDQLRDAGLIRSRQGFGWIVGVSPLRQSLDALATIEQQLAAAGRTSERQVLRFGFVKAPREVEPLLGEEVLEVVRLNLADDQPFAHVTVWCRASIGSRLSRRDVEQSTFVDLLASELGHATQVISAIAASGEIATGLAVELGSPLLRVWRVTADTDERAVMVSEHLYPAQRTEFEVTLVGPTSEPAGLRLVD